MKKRTIKPLVREYIKLRRRLDTRGAELVAINGIKPEASAVLSLVIDNPGCTFEDVSSESGMLINEIFQICDRLAKAMPDRPALIEKRSEKEGSGPYRLHPTKVGKEFFNRQFEIR